MYAGIVDSARRSLFFYQPGESWDIFYDPYFLPSYQPNFSNPELESQAEEICGEDTFCLFDIAATGNVDVGRATRESSMFIEEIYSFSIPGNYGMFTVPHCTSRDHLKLSLKLALI